MLKSNYFFILGFILLFAAGVSLVLRQRGPADLLGLFSYLLLSTGVLVMLYEYIHSKHKE